MLESRREFWSLGGRGLQTDTMSDEAAIRIGISACLLGRKVRFDGGHKEDRFITDTLGHYFEFLPVCPEVDIGLGTPRETIHLEQQEDGVHLIAPKSGLDHMAKMQGYARERAAQFARENLSGFILKKDSPSCGMERVRVHGSRGAVTRSGTGLFAAAVMRQQLNLPVEEEGRLSDPKLRENWIERVFAYHRLRSLWATRWKMGSLIEFHTAYKLTLLAHLPSAYESLGRLVGEGSRQDREQLQASYEQGFMAALARIATPGRHANVLQHVLGYFKKTLDAEARNEVLQSIDDYRRGLVPRIVPITLLVHHARRLDVGYLLGQAYLDPHPKELLLRYHV
jgi:uncharacterized protein YbgA (DUF1722 family)/uncharacterized protein YbbK (DUF523 family)